MSIPMILTREYLSSDHIPSKKGYAQKHADNRGFGSDFSALSQ